MLGLVVSVVLTMAPAEAEKAQGEGRGVTIVAGPGARPAPEDTPPPDIPDLGPIRYRDPDVARRLWLGLDVGGVYIPNSIPLRGPYGAIDKTVWAQRTSGSWALAFAPWLTAGGRHDLVFYDAESVRLQVIEHKLTLSGRPLWGRRDERLRDRLEIGVDVHTVKRSWIEDVLIKLGGVWDIVIYAGYGFDHRVHEKVRLGWNVQPRFLWVRNNHQRQVRASIRPTFYIRPNHALSLEAVGFYIRRDPRQDGNKLPRDSVAAQANLDYTWMSRRHVGLFVRLHYASSFMSGEAPVYEVRGEAINTHYGEGLLGLRAYW